MILLNAVRAPLGDSRPCRAWYAHFAAYVAMISAAAVDGGAGWM
jgi:hypothetical protein